ncbi:FAD-dependent oxidoreductase [Aliidongia dinghuensis]|uniref:FAD-dependent oxidoreductase n=1 Tax=Aliidongia dinghuensis TaxID=1867774 RepID=A0A8J2Z050_9PROT|nr:FAD-binding oxidoreductase [Aliidongia dinghuensis]GGF49082.1 FAD-dependent oxidoreductase [Aliidongia dinghuensis]
MEREHYDVIIIGGALWGGSTAFHLLTREPNLRICVIEKDASYKQSSSSLSVAGIRVLFSQPENVLMSMYGHEFYGDFGRLTQVDDTIEALHFVHQGYLFAANTPEQAREMEENYRFQLGMGCEVLLLDAKGVSERFPSLHTDDILCAAHSPNDGWIDPYGALMGLRRKAKSLGATYIEDEVAAIERRGARVESVTTTGGRTLTADWVVNTCGAWAPSVCAMVGMKVPVVPLPRMQFYFETQAKLEPLPLTRDGVGLGFRPEGVGYTSGITNHAAAGEFCWDVHYEHFDNVIWPKLATRVPAFEALKVKNGWAGHYAQNIFDGNMIIGPWTGELENFLIATGDSGHGLQHAPAVGRGLAELILDGRFSAIDLTAFTYKRVQENKPYAERGFRA